MPDFLVVTGAAGFIGSNIVAALNAAERDDIVAVDTSAALASTGHLAGLRVRQALPHVQLFEWLNAHASTVAAVIHMGACSDTTQTDRDFMLRNNLEYTRRLWQFCTRRQKPFVYASSAATYGDGSAGYDDAADPRRLKPLNLYGESKQLFDLWALDEKETPPRWAGLKFFNVYGPRENHKGRMASVVYHSFRQIQETGRVRLFKSHRPEYPDGGQQRDFVYVKDAVAATLHFLTPSPRPLPQGEMRTKGGLFNVGTGQARSFADLARAVFTALGKEPVIEYVPMPDDLQGRYQYFTQATIAKLRAAGFAQPFHSLEDGVRDYVCNYLLPQPTPMAQSGRLRHSGAR
jgi:ADP-L-glycero-D-manno-heptose 6-epimerase